MIPKSSEIPPRKADAGQNSIGVTGARTPARKGGINKTLLYQEVSMSFDFAPLFRTAIGFDRMARLMNTIPEQTGETSYPPYNIERTGDDQYRLTMAVAGFSEEDLDIVVQDNTLVVSGRVAKDGTKAELLYRGIAGRAFERRFVLADHIVVENADLKNGLLHIGLKRVVPEALKPRRVTISHSPDGMTDLLKDQSSAAKAA
jgi:molecular chaperone IbpA